MLLTAGTSLGPYEVVRPIGAGGMGEVYRAKDSRIGREVAIKILAPSMSDGADRLRRFEQEARATARISHPNVLAIHDVGTHQGSLFIVSELLDGENLREQINRGPLPRHKALDYSLQIANGLAAAHQKGVIHRDLKPENLFICSDGRVKILDFGIARLAESETGGDGQSGVPTLPVATTPGVVMGTVGYMSPEQVRAQTVDHRSDIFSFGAILFEMLTGKAAFRRASAFETMNAVLTTDPLESGSPIAAPLDHIVRHCLEKNREERFQSARDIAFNLELLKAPPMSQTVTGKAGAAPARTASWRRRLAVLVVLPLAAIVALVLLARPWVRPGQSAEVRFVPIATESADEVQPAWSHDGRTLAYAARVDNVYQIFTRSLDSPVSARITSSAADCMQPFWSPDGAVIYYISGEGLWAIGASGGAPRLAVQGVMFRPGTSTATISPDGRTLAFFRASASGADLYTIAASGGTPMMFRRAPFPAAIRFPHGLQFSPNGKQLLAAITTEIGPDATVEFWRVPMPDGTPLRVPLATRVSTRIAGVSWMPDNGRFVFAAELHDGSGAHLYSVDGHTGVMRSLTTGVAEERHPSVSLDGRRLAFSAGGIDWDLFHVSEDGGIVGTMLATSRAETFPIWAPDGRQYAYLSNANGPAELWLRSLDEKWARRLVGGDPERAIERAAFSPDGQRIAYVVIGRDHRISISNLSGGRAVLLEQESSDQHSPAWSPDGNYIAYARFMKGRWQIAKAGSGGGAGVARLTEGGWAGSNLAWSPSGKWVCFAVPTGVWIVPAEGGAARLLRKATNAWISFRPVAKICGFSSGAPVETSADGGYSDCESMTAPNCRPSGCRCSPSSRYAVSICTRMGGGS
jgi:Tol biopolymer transport system component